MRVSYCDSPAFMPDLVRKATSRRELESNLRTRSSREDSSGYRSTEDKREKRKEKKKKKKGPSG